MHASVCLSMIRRWCRLRSLLAVPVAGAIALVVAAVARGEPAAILTVQDGTIPGRLLGLTAGGEGTPPTIRWQSAAFERPFEFPVDRIDGIAFPEPEQGEGVGDVGAWRVELDGGDAVVGRLESIDDSRIVLSIGPVGAPIRLPVRRSAVRRMAVRDGGTSFVWNGSLDRLHAVNRTDWQRSGSGLANTMPGATLGCDAGWARRARYDLTLSWSEPPSVRIRWGDAAPSAGRDGAFSPGYLLELGGHGLVIVRDASTPNGTGVANLERVESLPGTGLSVSVFIDRTAGRIVVVRRGDSEPIADLTLPPVEIPPSAEGEPRQNGAAKSEHELQIDVASGTVSLDALSITPWRGDDPPNGTAATGTVDLVDGTSFEGVVEGMAAGATEIVVRTPSGDAKPIAIASVAEIRCPREPIDRDDDAAPLPTAMRVCDRFGTVLTSELLGAVDESLSFSHPAVDGPVVVPLGMLRSIEAVAAPTSPPALPGRPGRLAMDQSTHLGALVPVDDAAGPSRIGWLPTGSLNAAPFEMQADGSAPKATITFTEHAGGSSNARHGWIGAYVGTGPKAEPMIVGVVEGGPLSRLGVPLPMRLRGVAPKGDDRFVPVDGLSTEDVMLLLQGQEGTEVRIRFGGGLLVNAEEIRVTRETHPQYGASPSRLAEVLQAHERLLAVVAGQVDRSFGVTSESVVILVTGESLACQIESIGENGVRVRRGGAEPVTIPSSMVKALELRRTPGEMISPEKFRSLTTLPRSRRLAPPLHLVRSAEGDYLRGRVVGMDEKLLRIVLDSDPQGNPMAIPRAEVMRVIWLHPESLAPDWQPPSIETPAGLSVGALAGGTLRLRMSAVGIEGNVLVGRHPVLGEERIDLEKVDQLLVGDLLSAGPLKVPYAQWQLRPATEPRNLPAKKPANP